ncbi:MAG: nucleotidyl transferase AbiEii/AbiGii toxin family protein [Cyanobacteriota/Melainabacteria group bacterium]
MPDRRPMVFKGGTSLSKVFNLINRFSEDIDVSISTSLKITRSQSLKLKLGKNKRRNRIEFANL